jgi:hypothetical protein
MPGSTMSLRAIAMASRDLRCVARASVWALALFAANVLSSGGSASAADAATAVELAARQLVGAQQPSGQFVFEHDFILGGPRPDTLKGSGPMAYITREAAAAYGLSNYFLHAQNPDVGHALVAILRNLGSLSVPIAKAPGQSTLEATGILGAPFGRYKLHNALQWLKLLYRPVGDGRLVSYDRSYETAWGGATGLSLLTELQLYHASGNAEFAPLRRGWLEGLLVLYDAGRGFRELPDSIDENPLSNGEIWLAFAYYTRLFPEDGKTAGIVTQMDDYMMRTYEARPGVGFYSWGVNAAAHRLAGTSDAKFTRFIASLTRAYFDKLDLSNGAADNSCSETEGLATALRVLAASSDPDQQLIHLLRARIDTEMSKNRSLQIQLGQTQIELGGGSYLSSPSIAAYAGAFFAGRNQPYVRIDYTEHCISALLELDEGER